MSTFDSTKTALGSLLDDVIAGKIQLPDFQRGWVWDDEHIRSLLVSIARSFPIGAVMLLETGGDVHFQVRPVEGVTLPGAKSPERLILDGQQRLTSLTQVLKLRHPVSTRDEKKRELKRYYYFDIAQALADLTNLDEAIISIGEDRIQRANFGRDVVRDLGSIEKEYAAFCFPCNQTFEAGANEWMYGLMQHRQDRVQDFMKFSQAVLEPFRRYQVPVIELKKETSKEAVCLVFERVNTGGVPLSVFELVTATYAADGFNLRRDWYGEGAFKGRASRLDEHLLLCHTAATDFLQGISLLHTHERRQADLAAGKTGKEVAAVSAKREHILAMPLSAYQQWAELLTKGFLETNQFLRHLGFYHPNFLPYRAQLIPLAAALTHLGDRWLEPQVQRKLERWYWSGVFGELYGAASETRIALDLHQLLSWIDVDDTRLPNTVAGAGFQPTRLDTMRSRTSAAYRGLYVLLQRNGACDLYWKARMVDLDRNEKSIDIHHIFPRKWCNQRGISPRIYDSIINKTPISLKANRKIGGHAPSVYLQQLQAERAVQASDAQMNELLATHLIEPVHLRADNFENFFQARKDALLAIIETAMGKPAVTSQELPAEDEFDADEDRDDSESESARNPGNGAKSPRFALRLEFWRHTLEALRAAGVDLYQNVSPTKDQWLTAGSGLAQVYYQMIFGQDGVRIEFVLARKHPDQNKALFDELYSKRAVIEQRFGATLEWRKLEEKQTSKVIQGMRAAGFDRSNWPAMVEWLVAHVRAIRTAFEPEIDHLRELTEANPSPATD